MTNEEASALKPNDEIYFRGQFYTVAEVVELGDGIDVLVYINKHVKRVDCLRLPEVSAVRRCMNCQGAGCPVCCGFGKVIL